MHRSPRKDKETPASEADDLGFLPNTRTQLCCWHTDSRRIRSSMPPATAPLTGTTASRSSGGSGESDSSPENISGHDSASAAPPDDGESSMVSHREQAAAAGRAPRLRERDDGAATSTRRAAGADTAHLLPPPPTARRPGAAAHLQTEGGTRAGRRVQRGPERRRVPAQVRVRSGRGAHLPPPRSPAQPSRARSRAARAPAEDGARPGRAGLGGVAARGRPL